MVSGIEDEQIKLERAKLKALNDLVEVVKQLNKNVGQLSFSLNKDIHDY